MPARLLPGHVATLAKSFERHLRAANRSPRTVETYLAAVHQLDEFLRDRGMPTDVVTIAREHVESFVEHLVTTRSASTASNRFRALQQYFKYLIDEGEITAL